MSSKSRSPSPASAAAPSERPEGDAKEDARSSASPEVEEVAEREDSSDGAGPSSKQPSSSTSSSAQEPQAAPSESAPAPSSLWQAIWSPQHSAYYFFNSATQETTWTNPLQPEASDTPDAEAAAPTASSSTQEASTSTPAITENTPPALASMYSLQAAAAAQGIDPALAFLDPSLAAGPSGAGPSGYSHTAKFNARTGAFARNDSRDPSHLSEFERAKRMSEFYFDVGEWEKDVEARKQAEAEEVGKKRKKPTKTDLERFKEQKKAKKIAKTAWLRN